MLAGLGVVVDIELIAHGGAFCRFDIDEGDGVVGRSTHVVTALLADARDAQLVPEDGYGAAPTSVLITGDVDAVDTFGGVAHALALELILAPFADAQTGWVVGRCEQLESEPLSAVVLPVALMVAIVGIVGPMSVGLGLAEVTDIDADAVGTYTSHQ